MQTTRCGWSWLLTKSKLAASIIIFLLGMTMALVPATADTTYTFQGVTLYTYQGRNGYVPECECLGQIMMVLRLDRSQGR